MIEPREDQFNRLFFHGFHNHEIYAILGFGYPEDWKRIADARKCYNQKHLEDKKDDNNSK